MMVTLKSHSRGRKPETTVEAECGLRDRLSWEQVHLRQDKVQLNPNPWCVMCGALTGPTRPWMDRIDHWQDHPMRCR